MIFPDLPRQHNFFKIQPSQAMPAAEIQPPTKTIVRQWDETNPLIRRRSGPVRFQDDPVGYFKFFSICLGLVVWSWYWHQFI
jgi:hypothetical protein